MATNKKIDCWHFVREDRRLGYGCGIAVEPGFTYTEDGPIAICESGLHGSRTVHQALRYAPGPVLCRVRIWGEVTEHEDKLVGRHREVLSAIDVSSELRLWGCWCIRNTTISGGRTVWDLITDERSRKAVEAAEDFSAGIISKEQLAAAQAAAWSAAQAAAWSAAQAAAWSAAWSAAQAAAWSAAQAAAWSAAQAAAWSAAQAAATKLHSEELERRMRDLFALRTRK